MSNTITLKHPVTVAGTVYQTLTMRRPKVRDMLTSDRAGGSDAEREIRTFANLCEVATEVVEELDLADYQQLQQAYRGFLS